MKLPLYLMLLGTALAPIGAHAQVPVPAAFVSDAKTVLAPDFVREADVILVGRLSPDRKVEGVVRPAMTGYELIRGDRFSVGRGLIVPTGETIETNSPLALVFARMDAVSQNRF